MSIHTAISPTVSGGSASASGTSVPPVDQDDSGRRLSIHLKGRLAQIVRRLATESGMKVSDVVKASIASFEFLDEHARRGEQILIEDASGRLMKVAWPPRSPS